MPSADDTLEYQFQMQISHYATTFRFSQFNESMIMRDIF